MTDANEHMDVSDPQASMRKLHEDLRFANTLLSSVRIERDELKRQLAECRAELSRFRAGVCVCAVKNVSQAEAERDGLREALKAMHQEPLTSLVRLRRNVSCAVSLAISRERILISCILTGAQFHGPNRPCPRHLKIPTARAGR